MSSKWSSKTPSRESSNTPTRKAGWCLFVLQTPRSHPFLDLANVCGGSRGCGSLVSSLHLGLARLHRGLTSPQVANPGMKGWPKVWLALHNGGLIPVMLLIIFGCVAQSDPIARYIFASRIMVILARGSYAQYLFQFNVLTAISLQVSGYDVSPKLILLVVLPVTAYLVERYFTRTYTDYHRLTHVKSI